MSHLICVQDLQKGLVDVRLTLEAVLDLVDVVDGVIELHGLVVLERRPASRRAADGSVGLNGGRARRGVGWDGGVGLAGGCVGWRLNGLEEAESDQTNGKYTDDDDSSVEKDTTKSLRVLES